MTTKKDGGPAFPTSEPKYGQMINVGAMSLRDWFAGMALQSYMAAYHEAHVMVIAEYQIPEVAETAYKIADAMIVEREKKNE